MEYAQNQEEQKVVEPIVEVAVSKLPEIETLKSLSLVWKLIRFSTLRMSMMTSRGVSNANGKKGKTNYAYFEETSSHINVAPNRVPFGALHDILNTNNGRNSLPLQSISPQKLSTNKENITPMQTPRSNGSTSLGTNVGVEPAIQKKENTTGVITNDVKKGK
uniref:Uncharacterized protein n=1 Tax=Tanacetum cinerariifolium TaxID=118510 RepID=A0A6L2NUS5_TANCI|nr:hypothetical protein [Tanacetum cinerariifolium]